MLFDLDEILRITGAQVVRWPQEKAGLRLLPVEDVRYSSPEAIFFPIWESSVNARLLDIHVRAGGQAVVTYPGQALPPDARYESLGVLSLNPPRNGLYKLAAEARARAIPLVVGITGSSGKSSTKEYLMAILRMRYPRVRGTLNSLNRLMDCAGILLRLEGTMDELAVIEMGFAALGDVDKVAALARPFAGVITKVTADHLDGTYGSWERVVEEKAKLGFHLPPEGVLAVHAEDPGCRLLPLDQYRARVRTFGEGPDADVGYEDVECDETGTTFTLRLAGQRLPVRLQTYGAVQAANAAAAALVADSLGIDASTIVEGLEQTKPMFRRFAVRRYEQGITVIDDTFSSNVDALARGLESVARLAGGRRQIAVLGGIGALQDLSEEYHRKAGAQVVGNGFSELYLVCPDERTEAIRAGAEAAGLPPERIHDIAEQGQIPDALLAAAGPDTVFYCKASQYLWIGPQIDAFRAKLVRAGYAALDAR